MKPMKYEEIKGYLEEREFINDNNNSITYKGLFVDLRVDKDTIPEGKYMYHMRHGDDGDWCTPCTIEERVIVNFCGTFITDTPINFPDPNDHCIPLKTTENYCDLSDLCDFKAQNTKTGKIYTGEFTEYEVNPKSIPKSKFLYFCGLEDECYDSEIPDFISTFKPDYFCGSFISDKEIEFTEDNGYEVRITNISFKRKE